MSKARPAVPTTSAPTAAPTAPTAPAAPTAPTTPAASTAPTALPWTKAAGISKRLVERAESVGELAGGLSPETRRLVEALSKNDLTALSGDDHATDKTSALVPRLEFLGTVEALIEHLETTAARAQEGARAFASSGVDRNRRLAELTGEKALRLSLTETLDQLVASHLADAPASTVKDTLAAFGEVAGRGLASGSGARLVVGAVRKAAERQSALCPGVAEAAFATMARQAIGASGASATDPIIRWGTLRGLTPAGPSRSDATHDISLPPRLARRAGHISYDPSPLFREGRGASLASGLTPDLARMYETVRTAAPVGVSGGAGSSADGCAGLDMSGYARQEIVVSEDGGKSGRVAGWAAGSAVSCAHVARVNALGWATMTGTENWIDAGGDTGATDAAGVTDPTSFRARYETWRGRRIHAEVATAEVVRDAAEELAAIRAGVDDAVLADARVAAFAEEIASRRGLGPAHRAAFFRAVDSNSAQIDLHTSATTLIREQVLSAAAQYDQAAATLAKRMGRGKRAGTFQERLESALEIPTGRTGPVMKKEPFRPAINRKLALLLGAV